MSISSLRAALTSAFAAPAAPIASPASSPHAAPAPAIAPVEPTTAEAAIIDGSHAMVRRGLFLSLGFVALVLGWGMFATIAGAVVAHGKLVIDGSAKVVQHPDGGLVSEVRVKNGDRVKKGDVLLALDDTTTRAELEIIDIKLKGLQAKRERLLAERNGTQMAGDELGLRGAVDRPEVAESATMTAETAVFEARQRTRLGEAAQLRERIQQIQAEIVGLTAQLEAAEDQSRIAADELEQLENLLTKGFASLSRVNEVRQTAASLMARKGEITAQIARAKAQISETELQIVQTSNTANTEIAKDFRETQEAIADLEERLLAAQAKLRRVELRAPIDGRVHQLKVNTPGAVIQMGEPILQIVPQGDKLMIEAHIEPHFIDQVHETQGAVVRFSALDQKTTPESKAHIVFVSPDVEIDPRTGAATYRISLELDPGEEEKIASHRMIPGMPADVFIQTGERSVLSYFVKPMTDQWLRAFRER